MDRLLARVDKLPARAPNVAAAPAAVDGREIAVLARISKGPGAELRITACEWKGRRTIDVRTWARFKGEADFKPTRKGVMVDASKLDDLIKALRIAKQHA